MKYILGTAIATFLNFKLGSGTFSVLRFNSKQLTKGRMDPIVSPNAISTHVHTIMGGNGFSMNSTGDDLISSSCTNAGVVGDNSNYWFPSLYFKDPHTSKIQAVNISYVNIYYLSVSVSSCFSESN